MSADMIVNKTYILLEKIGSGKTGDVFKAKLIRNTDWGKKGDTVAIKQYKSWVLEEPNQAHRIYRELSIGNKLYSPYIVKTYEIVKENSKLFLIMEYLKGETLKEWLEHKKDIPFEEIKQFSIMFLKGLEKLHENELIHRDLKPENIMITEDKIVLMDLGVLKEKGASMSITGDEFIGTIKYSAPEYLFGEDYDERIDIFSFGLIIHEIIFGESLIKEGYWTKMIVESYYNRNIGSKDFLKYPDQFSEEENQFLWLILNCCLGLAENRLFCNELLSCFKKEIWEDIDSWDKFETHRLQFSKSNLIISNFLFIWKFEKIVNHKIKKIINLIEPPKDTKFAGFREIDGFITELFIVLIDINELPQEISYLKKLKRIHFQSTGLNCLPNSFGELTALKTMYLVGHGLKELPQSIGNLKSLDFLNILSFSLEKIPSSFGNLKNLKYLFIDTFTTESAEIIGDLVSLVELGCLKGDIKKLPLNFRKLINLRKLLIMSANLEDFSSICELKNLESLSLTSNNLKTIPNDIDNLSNLKKLELWSNSIEIIPKSIGGLKSLELLDLHENPLKQLPEEMENLQNLTELNIGKTAIKELPSLLLNLPFLRTIHIDFGVSYNEIRDSLKERGVNFEFSY